MQSLTSLPLRAVVRGRWHPALGGGPGRLPALPRPALRVTGGRTPPRLVRLCGIFSDHIPGGRLEVIPGAGHMSPLTHPEALAELLAAHLETH